MKEVRGDMWKIYDEICSHFEDYYQRMIVIPTNGSVKYNGEAVMGRGLALDAASRWPSLPITLGNRLRAFGNHAFAFPNYRLITFPVKHRWFEKADIDLIKTSADELILLSLQLKCEKLYIPHVGCGNGKLSWKEDVKPVIKVKFNGNSKFIIVRGE